MWRRDFSGWQWPLLSWASKFFFWPSLPPPHSLPQHHRLFGGPNLSQMWCGPTYTLWSTGCKNAPQQQHDFASSVQLSRRSPSCHSHTRWSCTHGKLSRVTRMSHTAAAAAAAVYSNSIRCSRLHSFIHLFIHSFRMTSTNKTLCNAVWAGQQGSKTNT